MISAYGFDHFRREAVDCLGEEIAYLSKVAEKLICKAALDMLPDFFRRIQLRAVRGQKQKCHVFRHLQFSGFMEGAIVQYDDFEFLRRPFCKLIQKNLECFCVANWQFQLELIAGYR